MANADGYVLPKPGIPKTLGILNVIFGVLLTLYGLCVVGSLLAAPLLLNFGQNAVKEVQAKAAEQQKARLKEFDDREKAAATDEEKKAIQQERDAVIANTPPMPNLDMSAATDVLKDPLVMGYSYVNIGTGAILSVILLISGIGLIRLTEWGRSLGVTYAVLQIVQVVLLTAVSLLYIQPIQRAKQQQLLAKMEADAKAPNAPPAAAESVRLARAMSSPGITTAMSLVTPIVGSIYPVILLVLLNNPGARAACRGPKPQSGPGEF